MSRFAGRLPRTYVEAHQHLQHRPIRTIINPSSDPRSRTRIASSPDGSIDVLYYGTVIATFYPDNTRIFTTAGHSRQSTLQRLNAMLPDGARFRLQDGRAVIVIAPPNDAWTADASTYALRVDPDGHCTTIHA